ncbi:MAG: hypothetical protein GY765_11200 [bacterium]|nr:hypothetical protein [bacterium]
MKRRAIFPIAIPLVFYIFSFFLLSPALKGDERSLWKKAGFEKPRIVTIDSDGFYDKAAQFGFTHEFDVTLVMLRETGWKKKVLLGRIKRAAVIFARCGVRMGKVKLVIAGAPGGIIDFLRPGRADRHIAQKLPPTPHPVLFFFRSIPQFNAYSWVETTVNEAVPLYLKNTCWISLSVTMGLNKKIRHQGYVSEAHELGHILLDTLEHTPEGVVNLMSGDYRYVNDELTAAQCEKIKKHHMVKRLK